MVPRLTIVKNKNENLIQLLHDMATNPTEGKDGLKDLQRSNSR